MILRLCVALILGSIVNAGPAAAFDIKAWYETSQRHFALLFVHGLGGDPKTTFGQWPDVIRKDTDALVDEDYGGREQFTVRLSDFDIFLADYPTKDTGMSIGEIGRQFADEIEAPASIFRRYDMVFVIVHSLGGLELHQAFDVLASRGHRDAWFRFVPAVLELGVPVNGSAFADAAQKFPRAAIDWLGYDPKLVEELKTRSNYLDALNKGWTDTVATRVRNEGWPIVYCGYETKAQAEIAELLNITEGKVVPPLYASNACSAGASSPIAKTHIDLPKVEAKNDDAHKLLKRMVQETLRSLEDKRYVQADRSTNLYDALSRVAEESTSKYAVDRGTGVRLYKERIRFNDPGGATRTIPIDEPLKGWSIDNAVRRAAGSNPCIAVLEADEGTALQVNVQGPCQ
jgi:hypothetical protein